MILLITVILLIGAGLSKAWLDYITDSGIKEKEWKNKWKNTNEGWSLEHRKKYHWWYFGLHVPGPHLEKFPFSSTILVLLTDKWHYWQFLMLRCFYLAIGINMTSSFWVLIFLAFIAFPIILGIPFELKYKELKK